MELYYDLSKVSVRTQHQIHNDYRELFSRPPDKLLGMDTNHKTIKGQKLGFLTGILYMAPARLSGRQLCAMSDVAGCAKACLNTAGRGAMTINQLSRLRKALFFAQYPEKFKELLRHDIDILLRKAQRMDLIPLVRLNGTSDIRWEIFDPDLFLDYPDLQFYDYTKLPNRKSVTNYDLTFSFSGVSAFQPAVDKAIEANMRIATVFRDTHTIPFTWRGMKVIAGDDSDVRHLDAAGVCVALTAKGAARHDQSGFVVN